jgi:hypothetical protein
MKERSFFLLIGVLTLLLITAWSHYATRSNGSAQAGETARGAGPVAIDSLSPVNEATEVATASPFLTSWLRRLEAWLWRQSPRSPATISNANAGAPFVIRHLEVSQAVQNLTEPVPLIAGKATVVRAYLESREGDDVGPISGTLYASSDNGRSWTAVKPENTQAATAVPAASFERAGDAHALRFTLSPALARGTLLLSLQTYVGAGDQWQRSNQVTLFFDESTPFRIAYLPLQFEGALPDTERIARAHTYMTMIYPVAQVDYFPLPYAAPYQGSKAGDQVTHFLRRLHALYHFTGWPGALGEPDQFFGWAPHSTWRLDGRADPYWFNNGGSRVAFGTDSPVNKAYQMIMAHEIGHNLGRQHPICDYTVTDWPYPTYAIHDVGFDFGHYLTTTPFVQPVTDDFMIGSNCGADIYANKWISAHTYQKVYESLAGSRFNSLVTAEPGTAGVTATTPVYLVSGRVQGNGRADFDTVFQVTAATSTVQQRGSDYCLVLEDQQADTLSEHCFDLSLEDARRYGRAAAFIYPLPYVPNAARLALLRGGERLAERPFTANVPVVELINPAPGAVLPAVVEVVWNGHDADGDSLSYIVSYSPDGGDSWYHLAYDFKGNRLAVDMARLPGGEQALFRVTASDGLHTAVATTGPFQVDNGPPQVLILLPEDNVFLHQGQTLLLSGYANDLEDGLLDDADLHWFSDVAGYLGSGRKIATRNLPVGRHTITLTAADSRGESAYASIQIEVR